VRLPSAGPLRERPFRVLFASTTVSGVGDGVARVALAFAVFEITDSATSLGLIIAARQLANALAVLAGGVWADRVPRERVLVAAALVQCAVQASCAGLLAGGGATVALLAVLQAVYGAADGFVIPATVGMVPQTVRRELLQQANALLHLSTNATMIFGPALGGVLLAAGDPALALAVDAASFLIAAILLITVRPRPAERAERVSFLHELREGFGEFTGQRWLWTSLLVFGFYNFLWAGFAVLGPLAAQRELGGADAWAAVLTSTGVGTVLGGLLVLRVQVGRPLLVSVLTTAGLPVQLAAFALAPPVPVLCLVAALSGAGLAFHISLWFTVFQERVPEHAMSRVSSYDGLFSIVLAPLGAAIAGPAANAFGIDTTLWIGAVAIVACLAALVALPDVRRMRRVGDDAPPGPPTAAPLAA
jgi:MFS family permease